MDKDFLSGRLSMQLQSARKNELSFRKRETQNFTSHFQFVSTIYSAQHTVKRSSYICFNKYPISITFCAFFDWNIIEHSYTFIRNISQSCIFCCLFAFFAIRQRNNACAKATVRNYIKQQISLFELSSRLLFIFWRKKMKRKGKTTGVRHQSLLNPLTSKAFVDETFSNTSQMRSMFMCIIEFHLSLTQFHISTRKWNKVNLVEYWMMCEKKKLQKKI